MRQFGRTRSIPPTPLALTRATQGPTAAQYHIAYGYLDQISERWHNHVLSQLEPGLPARHPADCVPSYMEWYSQVPHMIVLNPTYLSTFDPHHHDSQSSASIDYQLVWLITNLNHL